MKRWLGRSSLIAAVVASLWMAAGQAQSVPPMPTTTLNGEWPMYGGDLGNRRYSPLDQISAANFNQLEVAWRFKTDNLGTRPEFKLEGTPIVINGVAYVTAGSAERRPPGSCRAAASRTGVMGATSAFSTSPPATGWSRSTRRTVTALPASATME